MQHCNIFVKRDNNEELNQNVGCHGNRSQKIHRKVRESDSFRAERLFAEFRLEFEIRVEIN